MAMIRDKDFSTEFQFLTSRSSGAGGQNVNKVETKVEILFDIEASQLLTATQKQRVFTKLKNKIDNDGKLHIISQEHRSQLKNKEDAIEKFYDWIEKAVKVQKARKPTKPSRSSIEKRLKEKKINSKRKQDRGNYEL
jgi:ribosome-associated protein